MAALATDCLQQGNRTFKQPETRLSKLKVSLLVQVATNDDDVDFVEAEMMVNALKVKQPRLANVVVYDKPEGGHFFNRQVNLQTLVRKDTPDQIDSWSRTWKFLNSNLKPSQN
jgi:alpha/beta superfamily hydrolase